ncbi:MAG: hypothetical protein IT480_13565 [Gammaproteobacteria bacterium]|nr:hypothetical protein [Gammaproteobacteria bacterium]
MNRVPLLVMLSLVGVLAAAVTPQLQARTVNCVPDQGCPKGQSPPSCCAPPPCEITQALKLAQAEVNAIEVTMDNFVKSSNEPRDKRKWDLRIYEGFVELLDEASPCPENPFFEPAPLLAVEEEDQCEITYWADLDKQHGSASLEDMHESVNSCQELVEAEYKQAQLRRQICLTEHTRSTPSSLQERMLQDLETAKAKRDALLQDVERYRAACTVAPDAADARQAVDDDLVALDPSASKPRKQAIKKKAKRFGKKTGRK